MNWRSKARLAKAISMLPAGISHRTYYLIQRRFGSLRTVQPDYRLKAGAVMAGLIAKHRRPLDGTQTFLEIGTGRCLSLPISLWLCGAHRCVTVDLNPYLKSELVFEELLYLRQHQQKVLQLFADQAQSPRFRERLGWLLDFRGDLPDLFSLLNLTYLAPADAARLRLDSRSVDYHVSYGVLEHVERNELDRIFIEARRVLKDAGLGVHYATLADLFSGFDSSIPPVNFLQFSEEKWAGIAGNRYMYHNRLRVDELRDLFESSGFQVLELQAKIHQESVRLIQTGALPLAGRFRDKSPETNASQHAWITAEPCCPAGREI